MLLRSWVIRIWNATLKAVSITKYYQWLQYFRLLIKLTKEKLGKHQVSKHPFLCVHMNNKYFVIAHIEFVNWKSKSVENILLKLEEPNDRMYFRDFAIKQKPKQNEAQSKSENKDVTINTHTHTYACISRRHKTQCVHLQYKWT